MATLPAGGALNTQPSTTNRLTDNKFRYTILKLPNVSYFTKQITIPGLSLPTLDHETPFATLRRAGNKLEYDQSFTLTFDVDEDLANYFEIHNWMIGIGTPEKFDDYVQLLEENRFTAEDRGDIFSDARVLIYHNHLRNHFDIAFHDTFPTNLSELSLDYSEASDIQATVTFAYNRYKIERIG